MAFIGNQPTAVPLTSSQLVDGIITTSKLAADAVTSAKIADGAIVNVDVNSTAAVAYSKLNLATSIVNADISASAAIATTKLGTGAVLQVVSTTKTDTFSAVLTGPTFTDVTNLSLSITPSSTSSKILILSTVNYVQTPYSATFRLMRNSTAIAIGDASGSRTQGSVLAMTPTDANRGLNGSVNFLDSPNTTSATTYKIQVGIGDGTSQTMYVNTSGGDSNNSYIIRAVSTITAIEIKAWS